MTVTATLTMNGRNQKSLHHPVMVREVVEILRPAPGKRFIDATVGGGGHARALLGQSEPGGVLLGIDWDEEALRTATQALAEYGERFIPVRANFTETCSLLARMGWDPVDGVLLDLGLSSLQLQEAERGFSFQRPGPLDMRMDRRRNLRAIDLLNRASEAELVRLLREYGEEPRARAIARAILRSRPLATTEELARAVSYVARGTKRGRVHPATRTFQAMRIAVNDELENLRRFLEDGYQLLRPGGRMVILSYHSLEDRIVKEAFQRWQASCLCPPDIPSCICQWSSKARILTQRPVRPAPGEVAANLRARSARLRAVERVGEP